MFKNQQFYHKHIKKAIVAFGTIFTNININRVDPEGNLTQVLRTPLSYSTKQKFLSRIALIADAEGRGDVAISLPRMGFEIRQLSYDPSRKISLVQKNKAIVEGITSASVSRTFVSTPWNMSLSLYIFAKNQEDGLQILEQILPYFNPDFNVTVKELPELGIKRDIKITLDDVDYDNQYEGDFASRQSIIWTLNFTMRLNFYGHIAEQGIIREAVANAYATGAGLTGVSDYTRITASIATETATATASILAGAVTLISPEYIGAGYINPPTVTISGGGGSNATAQSVLNADGTINSIQVLNGGSGYTSVPTVTIEDPPDTVADPSAEDPYRFVAEFENIFE